MSTPSSEQLPDAASTAGGADRLLGGVAFLFAALWAIAFLYAAAPALPYSALRVPHAAAAQSVLWAPQGWSFFTRDPREEKQSMYVKRDGRWQSAMLMPHGRLRNVVGLRRGSRAQGVEMARLANAFAAEIWTSCADPLARCLETLSAAQATRNLTPRPTLCGEIAIVQQRQVPWAWARSGRAVHMPSRILHLAVSC